MTTRTTAHVLMVFMMIMYSVPAESCDCWIAMQDVTKDGSVILAKNSDRPPGEAQPLVCFPRRQHPTNATVKCTYIEIPQAPETYEHIGSKIWWTFGYEHGMNEHGVAIGNEAVWSKESLEGKDGLLGMDLVRLGLERGKTAHKAMHVIIELLAEYGQCGNCVHESEGVEFRYHNSFLIADPNEAWILETAGEFWVAKRITSGVYSISNIYTIETQWNECHPRLIQNAIDKGWAKSERDFNFARAYGDYNNKDAPAWAMQIRRNATLTCLKKELPSKISPSEMMGIARSHYEGTIVEPRWGVAETFWPTPCMHDSPNSPSRTAASMVAHLRGNMPPLLRQVYLAALGSPCCSVYQPFYLHGVGVPKPLSTGTGTYTKDSPWWSATRVKLLCDLNYPRLNPLVRQTFDATERWERQRQQKCEAEVIRLVAKGEEPSARKRLQEFVNENIARIEGEQKSLNDRLPKSLKDAGVEYLFLEYLKDWTQKQNVPLPLQ